MSRTPAASLTPRRGGPLRGGAAGAGRRRRRTVCGSWARTHLARPCLWAVMPILLLVIHSGNARSAPACAPPRGRPPRIVLPCGAGALPHAARRLPANREARARGGSPVARADAERAAPDRR